jgi:hypothetical protein
MEHSVLPCELKLRRVIKISQLFRDVKLSSEILSDCSTIEDEGTVIFRNVGKQFDDTASEL